MTRLDADRRSLLLIQFFWTARESGVGRNKFSPSLTYCFVTPMVNLLLTMNLRKAVGFALWFFVIPGSAIFAETLIHTKVSAVDAEARTLSLEANPEGGLDAGVVARVNPGDVAIGYAGRPVQGRLLESGGAWRLETIWPEDPVLVQTMNDVNTQLRRDTATRGRRMVRVQGDQMPQFALWDEQGNLRQGRDFRGKFIILNFIFSRCPVPTMCPANTTRMARLQREMEERGWSDQVELVSITLDPEYDTPGVLNYYGSSRGIDLGNFTFLTGPKPVVDDLLKQFGILTIEKDGTIDHTMATLIIDANGKIQHRKDGSRWSVEDFLSRLEAML